MKLTPIDSYVAQQIGTKELLNQDDLAAWQLKKINETLALVRQRPFYQDRFDRFHIASLDELSAFGFTTAYDLGQGGLDLVCVPQSQIARIVTLDTSGTTGHKKRVYFSKEDQELTIDYFGKGMLTLVRPGQSMAVLLPCSAPGGVGQLICQGIERVGVHALPFGLVTDFEATAQMLKKTKANALVGVPVQILGLARYLHHMAIKTQIQSVLLSVDHIDQCVTRQIAQLLNCKVYSHYGMTETGLGGAIDCAAHMGYHIREADLYIEIIDPKTGTPLSDGQWGEVVFTTLTRNALPLVRYRTGDISRIRREKCACGTQLRLLDYFRGRISGAVELGGNLRINMPDLDGALFGIDGIMDFWAGIEHKSRSPKLVLKIACFSFCKTTEPQILDALQNVAVIVEAKEKLGLEICVEISYDKDAFWFYKAKRMVETV